MRIFQTYDPRRAWVAPKTVRIDAQLLTLLCITFVGAIFAWNAIFFDEPRSFFGTTKTRDVTIQLQDQGRYRIGSGSSEPSRLYRVGDSPYYVINDSVRMRREISGLTVKVQTPFAVNPDVVSLRVQAAHAKTALYRAQNGAARAKVTRVTRGDSRVRILIAVPAKDRTVSADQISDLPVLKDLTDGFDQRTLALYLPVKWAERLSNIWWLLAVAALLVAASPILALKRYFRRWSTPPKIVLHRKTEEGVDPFVERRLMTEWSPIAAAHLISGVETTRSADAFAGYLMSCIINEAISIRYATDQTYGDVIRIELNEIADENQQDNGLAQSFQKLLTALASTDDERLIKLPLDQRMLDQMLEARADKITEARLGWSRAVNDYERALSLLENPSLRYLNTGFIVAVLLAVITGVFTFNSTFFAETALWALGSIFFTSSAVITLLVRNELRHWKRLRPAFFAARREWLAWVTRTRKYEPATEIEAVHIPYALAIGIGERFLRRFAGNTSHGIEAFTPAALEAVYLLVSGRKHSDRLRSSA